MALIFLQQHFPESVQTKMTLKAIFVPEISGQPNTTIEPISPAVALRALAPSTLVQLAANKRVAFQSLGQLVRRLPCYRLSLGTNVEAIPAVVAHFLANSSQ